MVVPVRALRSTMVTPAPVAAVTTPCKRVVRAGGRRRALGRQACAPGQKANPRPLPPMHSIMTMLRAKKAGEAAAAAAKAIDHQGQGHGPHRALCRP